MADDLQHFINNPIEGTWWRPEEPEVKFEGTLELDSSLHGTLKLKGPRKWFGPLMGKALQGLQYTLLGFSNRGRREWSLFDCGISQGPPNGRDPGEVVEATFYTNDIFIGDHIESKDVKIAAGLWLELTGLEIWCDDTGFTPKGDGEGNNIRLDGVALDYRNNYSNWIDLDKKTKLRMATVYRGPIGFLCSKTSELRVVDAFDLQFGEPISIRDCLRIADIWQSFLTYSTRIPSYRNIIGLRLGSAEAVGAPYALLTPGRRERPKPPKSRSRDTFLTKMKLDTRYERMLSAWWHIFDKLETPVMLYTGTAYQEGAYLHVRLLAYLQTLEILHRELFVGERNFPADCTWKETLKALRDAIPEKLPTDLRDAISKGLSFQGGMNLVERLFDLYDRYPTCLRPLFPDRDDNMKALRDARNFLTYYGDHKHGRDFLFSTELYQMSERARLFVEISILGALGFEDTEIKDLIRFFDPYAEVAHQTQMAKLNPKPVTPSAG